MKFDDILVEYVGEFGKYQKVQYILVNLPVIVTALHVLSWTFTSEVLPHRCKYVGENDSSPFEINANWTKELPNRSCQRFESTHYSDNTVRVNSTLQSCVEGYRWKATDYYYTAVSRWDLVCERKWVRSFVQLLYYVGQFFGSYILGHLSDKYGRKIIFLSAIILQLVCGTLMAVVPYWPMFAVLRIGLGFAHPGIFLIAVVIGSELVGPKQRILAGVGAAVFFSIGQILLGALAYLFNRYDYLQLTISLPAVIFISYYWFVPESARWLLANRRFSEANKILQKAAKINGRSLPDGVVEIIELQPKSEENVENQVANSKISVWVLFKRPILRRTTLICFYCWISVSCVYYALAINPSFLGGNVNVSFIIGGFLEMPILLIVLFTINRLGRRLMLIIGFVFCTVLMFLTLVVPQELHIAKMMLVLLAKSSLSAVYMVIYVYSSELFPTVIRNSAMGLCSMIARLGAVAASYFALWLAEDYAILVTILYGTIALLAACLTLLLPETGGKPMSETIEDAEKAGG